MRLHLRYLFIVLQMFLILSVFLNPIRMRKLSFLISANMYKPRFFKEKEFRKCKPSCEITDMDEAFLYKLDEARELAKTPFILNSAFRTVDYEKSKGRSGTSSHCKGLAVDLYCASSHLRVHIVSALIQVGFRRIGVYPTFIHVDSDEDKITAMWLSQSDLLRG